MENKKNIKLNKNINENIKKDDLRRISILEKELKYKFKNKF